MFLVPFRAKREENFEDICAPQYEKLKISKPYFQISVNFENLKPFMHDLEIDFEKSQKLESRGRRRRP